MNWTERCYIEPIQQQKSNVQVLIHCDDIQLFEQHFLIVSEQCPWKCWNSTDWKRRVTCLISLQKILYPLNGRALFFPGPEGLSPGDVWSAIGRLASFFLDPVLLAEAFLLGALASFLLLLSFPGCFSRNSSLFATIATACSAVSCSGSCPYTKQNALIFTRGCTLCTSSVARELATACRHYQHLSNMPNTG